MADENETEGTTSSGAVVLDGYSPAKDGTSFTGTLLKQTIQNVGNFSIKYYSNVLKTLNTANDTYTAIDKNGGIYLTGFKLESTMVSAEQQIENAKLVPLVNGDSITLTNICKAGTLQLSAARTAGGINGGDMVSVFDYVRSQGDDGGSLVIKWRMNGNEQSISFSGVCVSRCPPLQLAGNDVPDYPVILTYSNYTDSTSPAYNENLIVS